MLGRRQDLVLKTVEEFSEVMASLNSTLNSGME